MILMDIQMPGRDGLTAIRLVKSNPITMGIPIVALTAPAMPGDRERCLEAGADAYPSKPVVLRDLFEVLCRFLGPAREETAAMQATGSISLILIIDDELAGRRALESLLLGQGYGLAFACNGSEGLSMASRLEPDLIVLDVMMPEMDGLEYLRLVAITLASPRSPSSWSPLWTIGRHGWPASRPAPMTTSSNPSTGSSYARGFGPSSA